MLAAIQPIETAADGDPRREDLAEIHKAATTALGLTARLFPANLDTSP
jgi:hypothetical protein